MNHRLQHGPTRILTNILLPLDSNHIAQTIELQRANLPENIPAPIKPEVKCNYCSVDFASELIAEHTETCDMRKIPCDRCGERILMDIFDFHFEECEGQPMEYINPQGMRNQEEMDDESMEDEEINITETTLQQEGNLTYEVLLRLDETIVKKGMSPEQLKEFPIQLYVKSLDGEGSCNICLYEYETGDYVRKLSCCHKFHKGCIDKWLDTNITCPMCKKYLR